MKSPYFYLLSCCVSKSVTIRHTDMILLFPFIMSWVPHPALPSRVHICISFIWKAGCMDVEVKVWCGAGIQPAMVSWLDQREQELTNLCLAMTHGAPEILLTRFGCPITNGCCGGAVYPAVSSTSSSAPPESPDSGLNHSQPDNVAGSSQKARSVFLI